jgi:hypothetical protein
MWYILSMVVDMIIWIVWVKEVFEYTIANS